MTIDNIYTCCGNLNADATITVYERCIDRHTRENGKVYSFNNPVELYGANILHKTVWLFWIEENNIDVILEEVML